MTLKGDAIFKEKSTGGLENDIRIWLIFMRAVASLKICTMMGSFCPKHKVLDEKVQKELCLMTLKRDSKKS